MLRFSARFCLMDFPDFFDMFCRGDLSLMGDLSERKPERLRVATVRLEANRCDLRWSVTRRRRGPDRPDYAMTPPNDYSRINQGRHELIDHILISHAIIRRLAHTATMPLDVPSIGVQPQVTPRTGPQTAARSWPGSLCDPSAPPPPRSTSFRLGLTDCAG